VSDHYKPYFTRRSNRNSNDFSLKRLIIQKLLHKVKHKSNGLDDRMIGVRFPAGAANFSLRRHIQSGSGTHLASYPMGTGGSFPGGKAATDLHIVLRSKNAWSYTSTPQNVFRAWCLVKHRDFTFLRSKNFILNIFRYGDI
jgi:hypothetical protein